MDEKRMVEMPAVFLSNLVAVPDIEFHFDIKAINNIRAVRTAVQENRNIFVATMPFSGDGDVENFEGCGVVCKIEKVETSNRDYQRVYVKGVETAKMVKYLGNTKGYWTKIYLFSAEEKGALEDIDSDAAMRMLTIIYGRMEESGLHIRLKDRIHTKEDIENPDRFANYLLFESTLPLTKKIDLIATINVGERIIKLLKALEYELSVYKEAMNIQKKVDDAFSERRKEVVLREQLEFIKKELGEGETPFSAVDKYKKQLEEGDYPEEVVDKINGEIHKMEMTSPNSADYSVSANYIETLLDYPWKKYSEDNESLEEATEILMEDHYGLMKVKDRIIDCLAVHMMNPEGKMPVICLVGPPGTGKTSIAKSIARAMHREYVRVSLGGVRDVAEIRGHRRTYVGAIPGSIVSAISRKNVGNPLVLLDEIDKVSDERGSVFAALLEVLDGEQNNTFRDHYFDVPVDLSKVLFVCTANDISEIKGPLRDRMEIIQISGYTEIEKFHIAKNYLIKKVKVKNGLKSNQLIITDKTIYQIIEKYTKEAGVRNLERMIDQLARKAVREILSDKAKVVRVNQKNLSTFLGVAKYLPEEKRLKDEVGAVTGLAWTSVGGVTMQLEAVILPGKGEFKFTGSIGDVMLESSQIALSYVLSRKEMNQFDEEFMTHHIIHIHAPEGAVPKDGPSAGVTLATLIYSVLANKKIRGNVAMTGEITLRGTVTAIGGLKEKMLAAKMAGKNKVIIPEENRKDLEEIDAEIKEGLEIVCVSTIDEVYAQAIIDE